MILAALTSVVWGFGFVVAQFGLRGFSPAQLTALRFIVASVPIFFMPRPRISVSLLVAIGMTLFTGQFLLLFFAFANGMPAGLASVSQQMQAFFTVFLAAVFLGDIPTLRQCAGIVVAFAGLGLIGFTVGADLKLVGMGLALAAAFSWAIGNVLVKRASQVPMFPLMVWCSLVPPLPALAVSAIYDPLPSFQQIPDWQSIAAVAYLGAIASLWAYTTWGGLLQRYPTAILAPFALIAPCVGVLSAAVILGEAFGLARVIGMTLILAGLFITLVPGSWFALLRRRIAENL